MSDATDRLGARETAEMLRLQIPILEPEAVERIAERETERIEYEAERVASPDKWRSERGDDE